MNSSFRSLSHFRSIAEDRPSGRRRGWPPRYGLSEISSSGGVRKPYQMRSEINAEVRPQSLKPQVVRRVSCEPDGAGGKFTVKVPLIE